ncbi:MAG: prepilin-type N-terminal cleavage/methylation domain-containing protein [Clostridia bacterium]|nr:prepilin-type N-terminal cleavage/methylation domain-containing protein [Clostridia bacterium]
MKKLNKKGFTIVELVIVIAVIAILAAVLIPTFAKVIEKANDSAALQAARNEFTSYLAGIEAKNVSGTVEGNYLVEVDANHYFVILKGELDATVYRTSATAATSAGITIGANPADVTDDISGCDTNVKIYSVTKS